MKRPISWLLVLACVSAALLSGCPRRAIKPAPPTTSSSTLAFVGVAVVPLDSERVLANQTVVVAGDRIVSMGDVGQIEVPAGVQVIDGRGKYLLPGLVDMHAHLATESDLILYLARGVTTVRNMWGAPIHLEWRRRIEAGVLRGPSMVTAGPILDGFDPVHDGSLVVATEEDADRAVKMHLDAGFDFTRCTRAFRNRPISVSSLRPMQPN